MTYIKFVKCVSYLALQGLQLSTYYGSFGVCTSSVSDSTPVSLTPLHTIIMVYNDIHDCMDIQWYLHLYTQFCVGTRPSTSLSHSIMIVFIALNRSCCSVTAVNEISSALFYIVGFDHHVCHILRISHSKEHACILYYVFIITSINCSISILQA